MSLQIIAVEDILPIIQAVKFNTTFYYNNIKFKRNINLNLILKHGTICACCKKDALFFIIIDELDYNHESVKALSLIFEHQHIDGSYAYMTRDHIIPKSCGGPDRFENYQIMCSKCNFEKSSNMSEIIPNNLKKYIISSTGLFSTDIEYYKSYIRWFTIIYLRDIKIDEWKTSKSTIKITLSKLEKVNSYCFSKAFDELQQEFYKNTSKRKRKLLTIRDYFKNA